ncbi:MAG: filamentous hemagglutinin N-terminal domain-containing protein, partial [Candidatus Omnitrophica bacterium]|nr:filamentous hemagglutinin N-terminal domain-containing protein [Candidatus Omnitrophota bacterium]
MSKTKYLKKRGLIRIFILISLLYFSLWPKQAFPLPEGWSVQEGSADFNQPDSQTLNITTSDKAIINYNSFSIAQPEAVNFYQPSSSSVALNRVVGLSPSEIFGILTATGKIYLINPNGILFGPTSRVDVAGLV